ncbi:MAG: HAMP domain-containing sensor histidine kinase [Patescibacteria group bacterium]
MNDPAINTSNDSPSNIGNNALLNSVNLQEIAKAIYERNAELVKLDKMKDEFVSLVSHELRTPLTIIKNYLWLVVNDDKDKVGEEPMKKIQIAISSVDRLMMLVEDTLTVSRLENGKISLKKEVFDLVKRVEYIAEIYAVKYQEKKIHVEVVKDLPSLEVQGDLNRLHEVIVNIFGNSIKFTPENGAIILRVGLVDKENAFVSITDNGPGIAKEKQEKLFTKFGKIDESYANLHNASGTGLGLYISQEIMRLHGGSISVQSDFGKGATFTLTLPIGKEKV